jgi:hypothetical protein
VLPADLQWGNVAEWAGALGTAGALLLAIWLLGQDRRNAQRAQVDLVGAWGEPRYERRGPDAPRVEQTRILIYVRNGSELPIVVKQLAYSIHTRWWVPCSAASRYSSRSLARKPPATSLMICEFHPGIPGTTRLAP